MTAAQVTLGCYEAARAAALAGLPPAVVARWARRRVLLPSVARERERLWSWADLVALRLAWARVAAGGEPGQAAAEVADALDGLDLEAAAGDGKARGGLVPVRRLLADPGGRLLVVEPGAAPAGSTDLLGVFRALTTPAPPAPAPARPRAEPGGGRTAAQRLAGVPKPAPGNLARHPAFPAHAPGPDLGDLAAARRSLGLPALPLTAGLAHQAPLGAAPAGFSRRQALGERDEADVPPRLDELQVEPGPPEEAPAGPAGQPPGPDLLRPRPALRIVPGKVGGEPHLAGTRLTSRTVAALARRGMDLDQIAALYPDHAKGAIAEAIELELELAVGDGGEA